MTAHDVIDAGDVLIVGGGLAGLFTALKLAPRKVTLLAGNGLGAGTSSAWAQGGIAAALGPDDSPEQHAADTIAVGAGLVDTHMARLIAEEAPARIDDLVRLGVPFDRDAAGHFVLGREGAHSRARIVRVSGDRAGQAIIATLGKTVATTPSIRILAGYRARALAVHEGRVCGVFAEATGKGPGKTRALVQISAGHVVLATGGVGALYAVTTNPPSAQGDGLAMAAEAGALVADAEFVQFHPTAIAVGRDPAPLATEALRGEGAILVNGRGERFMLGCHPLAELAPRDVVARAIHRQLRQGGSVYLDCRKAVGARFPERFPTVYAACRAADIDPVRELIPVAPAAHYHMGGVAADDRGRTTLPGLSVCGEVSSTGAHGANRLASNSLLEALVLGARIAEALSGETSPRPHMRIEATPFGGTTPPAMRRRLRQLMTHDVGLERTEDGLRRALAMLRKLRPEGRKRGGSAATAGLLIAAAALARHESRGSHFRADYPDSDFRFARRTFLTLSDALAIAEAQGEESVERLAQ
jgi:L-aspartate oxidase